MIDLSARADLVELMDAPTLDPAVYARCLRDLAAVNRVTFTHRATLAWLHRATADLPPGARISVFDIAYGQGDLLRAIAGWAARRQLRAELSGIDLNPRAAAAARAAAPAGPQITYLTGDVFGHIPAPRPDFIVSSQFTHHLPDAQILRLLAFMEQHAARGWHIADLHRSRIAYHGFPLLARLLRWHRIVRLDGTASIARGFSRRDWEALLAQAGLAARIEWQLAFRYSVSRLR